MNLRRILVVQGQRENAAMICQEVETTKLTPAVKNTRQP
jgi:hypothetical protein